MWPKLAYHCTVIGGTLALSVVTASAMAQGPGGASQAHSPIPGASAGVTAFVHVNVIPMDKERVLSDHTVLIEGGRITGLGPAGQIKVPAGATRIDGRGQFLIPGLSDMHVHLLQLAQPSDSASVALAERHLLRWLAQGVTTVRNMDYTTYEDGEQNLRLRKRAAAGEILSPRIYTSGHWPGKASRYTVAPESVTAYVTAYKAAGFDFIKGRGEPAMEHDSLGIVARRLGIPIAGHAPKEPEPEQVLAWAVQQSYASMEHYKGFIGKLGDSARVHALAAATKRSGVWHCPTLIILRRSASDRMKNEYRFTKALQDAGAGLLAGTDAAATLRRPTWYGFHDPGVIHRELSAFVHAGLTPYQALTTSTRNVAQYFGTLAESGTITVGKRADLVLLGANPLADIRHTRQVTGVMLGGRWLDRAELDRRTEPGWEAWELALRYQSYVAETYTVVPDSLTREQSQVYGRLYEKYRRHASSLIDSLRVGPDSLTGDRRILQVLARQLGEQRVVLRPAQHDTFDRAARRWLEPYTHYGVTIPGVRP